MQTTRAPHYNSEDNTTTDPHFLLAQFSLCLHDIPDIIIRLQILEPESDVYF